MIHEPRSDDSVRRSPASVSAVKSGAASPAFGIGISRGGAARYALAGPLDSGRAVMSRNGDSLDRVFPLARCCAENWG